MEERSLGLGQRAHQQVEEENEVEKGERIREVIGWESREGE